MKRIMSHLILFCTGFLGGAYCVGNKMSKTLYAEQKKTKRESDLFYLFNDWLYIINNGSSIGKYIKDAGYDCVAIYGMGQVGHRLKEDLEKAGVDVKYGIDRNQEISLEGFDIYTLEDELPQTDLIIVTALQSYDEIRGALISKTSAEVTFIKDIVEKIVLKLPGTN